MGRARNHIQPGGAGEARPHAVGARIASDQAVEGRDDAVAQLQRADAEQVVMLGEFLEQGATDHRHVARRGPPAGCREAPSD